MNLSAVLSFRDGETKTNYALSKFTFYARSTILITIFLFLIAAALQVQSLFIEDFIEAENGKIFTLVSWLIVLIFVVLCFVIRKALWAQKLICPLLTVYISYLMSELEIDG